MMPLTGRTAAAKPAGRTPNWRKGRSDHAACSTGPTGFLRKTEIIKKSSRLLPRRRSTSPKDRLPILFAYFELEQKRKEHKQNKTGVIGVSHMTRENLTLCSPLNLLTIKVSVEETEHRILRPIWWGPRIHFGHTCASIGCPNLDTDLRVRLESIHISDNQYVRSLNVVIAK
jgi:hypothetical protein